MERFNDLFFVLFSNIMVSYVDMFCLTFDCWIYRQNIAAWLSKHSGIGPSIGKPISPLRDLSHAACHPMLANSMYSASPTDNATIFCCWDVQDIAPLAIRKTCPDVEWQSSLFSPQFESEYPIDPASEFPSYLILNSFVPLKYFSTYFAYLICSSVGLLLNRWRTPGGTQQEGKVRQR